MLAIEIDGDVRVIHRFEEAVKKVGSPITVLSDIGDVMITEFTENFPEEGRRLNEEWAELAESTKLEKARLGYGGMPILVRTGNLMTGFRKEADKFRVRVDNPVEYFKYHQLGGGNLPQRRMILFPERLKQEVVAVFTKFIHDALNSKM